MSKRRVRPDELELWNQVAKSADPLHNRPIPTSTIPNPVAPKPAKPTPSVKPVSPFQVGDQARTQTQTRFAPTTTSEQLGQAPVQMDSKAFTRMKRGKLVPEGRIDLHGMTLDSAFPALSQFVLTSQARGLRLVLVITGKGQREDPYDPMPRRRGVLKTQVPQWLRMAPLSQAILQVSEAHRSHGGAGAYYVYLRRRK